MLKSIFLITLFFFGSSQISITNASENKVYSSEDQLGEIPYDDHFDENGNLDKDAKNFAKNWVGKTITIRGKLNQAGYVLIEATFVTGCKSVTKGIKLSSIVTVTGKLKSRSVGGSGGAPLELSECKLVK